MSDQSKPATPPLVETPEIPPVAVAPHVAAALHVPPPPPHQLTITTKAFSNGAS